MAFFKVYLLDILNYHPGWEYSILKTNTKTYQPKPRL